MSEFRRFGGRLTATRILKKKGPVIEGLILYRPLRRVKGSHHLFYHPETKRRAVVPVHGRDHPTGTLLEILKQARIEREEIKDLL